MRFSRKLAGLAAPALIMAAMLGGCKTLKDVTSALTDLKKTSIQVGERQQFPIGWCGCQQGIKSQKHQHNGDDQLGIGLCPKENAR